MSASLAVTTLAAQGEAAKSGPWGFAIILVLGVACYFLFKSMSRHMKYVREHPPTEWDGRTAPGAGPSGTGGTEGTVGTGGATGVEGADPAPPMA